MSSQYKAPVPENTLRNADGTPYRANSDGKLGGLGYEAATVEYYNAQHRPEGTAIYISGGYGDMESSSITLDAKQALSLLSWLQQERKTLEQLAGKEHS